MKAFKGFDKDLKCRGFQYEINKEYEEEKASLCKKGFHACEHPLDVFGYYPPTDGNRFCEVEIEDNGERNSSDTKVCGTKIKIGAEIGIKGLIRATFDYVKERCTSDKTGGDWSVVYGGAGAKVRAGKGSVLALQYWKDGEFKGIKFKEVDGVKIKENTWYKLDSLGRFIVEGGAEN
jgi:hypothetical protein